MRIAMLVPRFPVVSELFIVRQITGLLDLGHEVDIYAEWPGDLESKLFEGWPQSPTHPEIDDYGLLDRTTYIEMPLATGYWDQSVLPLWGKTWLPGAAEPLSNARRATAALPKLARAALAAPHVTASVLDPGRYGLKARSLSSVYRVAKLSEYRDRRYDVVHAQFGWTGRDYAFAGQLLGAPLVVAFRGGGDLTAPDGGAALAAEYREAFDRLTTATVGSEFSRGLIEELGCEPSKVEVLPSPIPAEEFEFSTRELEPREPVRILTVARLTEMKGIEYALRAVAALVHSGRDVIYDVVGEGDLRARLEALIGDLGIEHAVTLHGACTASTVKEMLARAHLFVLASVTAADGQAEGQGGVLQEAQASGLPVVATDHGPFAEGIVPGESGFLVPERDADALAARLEQLVDDPEAWAPMGRAGRAHVETKYDRRALTRQLVDLYEHARVRSHHVKRPGALSASRADRTLAGAGSR